MGESQDLAWMMSNAQSTVNRIGQAESLIRNNGVLSHCQRSFYFTTPDKARLSVKSVLSILVLALSSILFRARDVQAQMEIGGQALYNASLTDGSLGLGASAALPLASFDIRGEFNWYFPDCSSGSDCEFWEVAVDGTTELLSRNAVSPYVGVGVGYQNSSVSVFEERDTPVRVIFGLDLTSILSVNAYGESAYLLPNDIGDQLIFSLGVRF